MEICFTAASAGLLVPGVARTLRAAPGQRKTVGDAMREAVAHGAVLLACTDALHVQGVHPVRPIPECKGRRGGAVQFMARAADLRWRTLVF